MPSDEHSNLDDLSCQMKIGLLIKQVSSTLSSSGIANHISNKILGKVLTYSACGDWVATKALKLYH